MFERDEILCRGRAVDVRHERHGRAGEVHGHGDAVLHRIVADLLGFDQAARGREIGMDHVDRAHVDQLDEVLFQIDVFAGQDRRRRRGGDLLEQLAELPGHHVLHPREVPLLHRAGELDATVDADVTVMIRSERNLHPDGLANLADPIGQPGDALVGDRDSGKWMHDPLTAAGVDAERH